MLDDVLQAFLRDAVQRDLDVVGQPGVGQVDVDLDLGDGPRQAGQPAGQAEVVEHRRAQPVDRRAGLLQGEVDQLAGHAQLLGGRRGVVAHRPAGGVQPVGQRDQPLGDAVVDVAGQPAPLDLLGLDDLLDEVLVRTIAGHQLPVQPAWCMAPAISRPMTSSNSTSRSVNSRRCTVCTLSTPTRPPGSVSIGTDTIEVKSDPRSDSNGM